MKSRRKVPGWGKLEKSIGVDLTRQLQHLFGVETPEERMASAHEVAERLQREAQEDSEVSDVIPNASDKTMI